MAHGRTQVRAANHVVPLHVTRRHFRSQEMCGHVLPSFEWPHQHWSLSEHRPAQRTRIHFQALLICPVVTCVTTFRQCTRHSLIVRNSWPSSPDKDCKYTTMRRARPCTSHSLFSSRKDVKIYVSTAAHFKLVASCVELDSVALRAGPRRRRWRRWRGRCAVNQCGA